MTKAYASFFRLFNVPRCKRAVAGFPVVAFLLLATGSFANAELRVLVQYDEQVHSLLRLVVIPESDTQSAKLTAHAPGNAFSRVSLKWFGPDGQLMHTGSIVDPRLVHAPLTDSGVSPQVVGLNSGAYMVSGPTGSVVLEIQLPANPTLGLGAHTHRLDLPY